jgi:hypothetical protein
VERILHVDIIEDFRSVCRLAVDGIMVVEPLVHFAIGMTREKVGVHCIEHVLKIADFPIT